MKNFNDAQIEFIKENHANLIDEIINDKIDLDFTYYSDIEEAANRFSNIVEILNGKYTMQDLIEDLYDEYHGENFEDVASDVYDELSEEEQEEIDSLED